MRSKLVLSFVFIFVFLSSRGQDTFDAEKTFYDARFHTLYHRYEEALDLYKKLLDNGYRNENIFYLTGTTYLHIPGLKALAIPWLEKAVKNTSRKYKEQSFTETRAPIDAWLQLGKAYQITRQLDKAIQAYGEYIQRAAKANLDTEAAKRMIASCDTAEKYLKKTTDIEVSEPASLNISDINYNVAVSEDGLTLVFMSDAKYYHAIYFTRQVNGHWTNPRNITMEVESDGNYNVCSLTADGKDLILSAPAGNNGIDLFMSTFNRYRWSPAKSLGKKINSFHNEVFGYLTPDKNSLLFVSDRPGGIGSLDIYKATKNEAGEWDNIVNLGQPVNTPMNENSPVLTRNGTKLYYSSDGYTGMGGYDVFISTLQNGKWSFPRNAGHPPNTTDDDLNYVPVEKYHLGYIAMFGHEEKKKASIQSIEFFSKDHPRRFEVTGILTVPPQGVTNDSALLRIFDNKNASQVISELKVPVSEPFKVKLPPGDYNLAIISAGTDTLTQRLSVLGNTRIAIDLKPVLAEKKVPVKSYILPPVYFQFDKSELTAVAKRKLLAVKTAMDSLPELLIIIEGHTDEIGAASYNRRLSVSRSKAVAGFLESQGIRHDRIEIKGFGESMPVAINHWPDGRDCPEGRKFNRRVTFSVKGNDSIYVKILPPAVPDSLKLK